MSIEKSIELQSPVLLLVFYYTINSTVFCLTVTACKDLCMNLTVLHCTHQIVSDVKPFISEQEHQLHTKRSTKLPFICFLSPEEKRREENLLLSSLLARVDPVNVTFMIHMLLDMTLDKRWNQANKAKAVGLGAQAVKGLNTGSFCTGTEYKIICVKPPESRGLWHRHKF